MKNKNLKILFSEQNPEQMSAIKRFFNENNIQVFFCAKDGKEVLRAIEQVNPDVIVVDVFLSSMDAVSVRKACDSMKNCPELFFATGSFDSEKVAFQIMEAGFSFYFLKPYDYSCLLKHIENHMGTMSDIQYDETELEVNVSETLHNLGVPAHIKDYHFLRQAIVMVIKDPDLMSLVTKRLYPDVAELNKTTASRVERAIRHAIEVAWDRGNVEVMNDYFGYTINNMRGKPTNSEFIAMVSDRMRLAMRKSRYS